MRGSETSAPPHRGLDSLVTGRLVHIRCRLNSLPSSSRGTTFSTSRAGLRNSTARFAPMPSGGRVRRDGRQQCVLPYLCSVYSTTNLSLEAGGLLRIGVKLTTASSTINVDVYGSRCNSAGRHRLTPSSGDCVPLVNLAGVYLQIRDKGLYWRSFRRKDLFTAYTQTGPTARPSVSLCFSFHHIRCSF